MRFTFKEYVKALRELGVLELVLLQKELTKEVERRIKIIEKEKERRINKLKKLKK